MKTRMFLLAALIAALMLGGYSQGAFAKGGKGGGGSKLKITLTASANYPKVKGSAAFKAKTNKTEFEAEVEHLKTLRGATLTVWVNGAQVGSAVVDGLGAAHLNLSSELGDSVPAIQTGSQVQVQDPSGVVIVSGTF